MNTNSNCLEQSNKAVISKNITLDFLRPRICPCLPPGAPSKGWAFQTAENACDWSPETREDSPSRGTTDGEGIPLHPSRMQHLHLHLGAGKTQWGQKQRKSWSCFCFVLSLVIIKRNRIVSVSSGSYNSEVNTIGLYNTESRYKAIWVYCEQTEQWFFYFFFFFSFTIAHKLMNRVQL